MEVRQPPAAVTKNILEVYPSKCEREKLPREESVLEMIHTGLAEHRGQE